MTGSPTPENTNVNVTSGPTGSGPRREFLKTSATVATGAAITGLSARQAAAAEGSNSRLRIGFIGPGGRGFGAHVKSLANLHKAGRKIDLVAVAEVYELRRDQVAEYIEKETGTKPAKYVDYRDMLEKENLDAVCIGTPDHWHHKQTVDALNAGLAVYCEKPMCKTVEEAFDVEATWKKTGMVMQVGVQSTSLPVWDQVREMLQEGKIGKVLGYQTEYFRNSSMGQWRYYKIEKEMTPKTIDWDRWLGVEEGLAESVPFDREVYRQWRRFWPFGSGMYTDLFVHRTTAMLKATGLRLPGRVVGAGGLYMEYDGRDVPDVATVAADFYEGAQGLVTATMCNEESRIQQLIRGHNGTIVFGNNENFDGFDFIPERPQVTRIRDQKEERIAVGKVGNTTLAHFENWLDAIEADDPMMCNNPPDLGAAAIAIVNLGAKSYRDGVVYFIDKNTREISTTDPGWAKHWEKRSHERGEVSHIPGWKAGDTGSVLEEPEYMSLGGPWIDGKDPANG
ncbi:Inositol 2-dehydrogenase [Roseimaritima multifibrata]|uniref:Inositol 2-dehydrogenase n=1 Tax=Roseimaritima multifibrata TaxID=1930274 RepID=A0A517MD93_9BACT|nr:Gfo/Idh/MocA family oxidoreductase [Roseimaritima multifibrata]QDS92864.1 Inositol 2-dehydrogenase [Roseimaritima multifibrata]